MSNGYLTAAKFNGANIDEHNGCMIRNAIWLEGAIGMDTANQQQGAAL